MTRWMLRSDGKVQESGSFVVRLLTCMCPDFNIYSSPSCHTSCPFGLLITGRIIHNYIYSLRTENGIHYPSSRWLFREVLPMAPS